MTFTTINPSTEEEIATYPLLTIEQINQYIDDSYLAFMSWRKTSFEERSRLMNKLAYLLNDKLNELSLIITEEMGKPISQSRAEIEKCAWLCEHYAQYAEQYLKDRFISTEMKKTKVTHLPLGIIIAIMPWNFPFWQVLRCAVPSIMAGNAVLLKHAPISLGAGNAIEQLFAEAGFPSNLFKHIIISNDDAAKVIAHDKVRALSFTGSEQTGRIVGACAAANLKKSVLELGGSDPYLILEDANLDLAAQAITTSRLNNCGQVCIAAKRVIAVDTVYDALKAKILALMADYRMGDPNQENTKLGPMARLDLRDKLHQQVQKSIQQGASLVQGGNIPAGKGFYYPATLLEHVRPGMVAFDEELFGPVIVLIKAEDEKEAIQLANNSHYGLGAAVFSENLEHAEELATYQVDAGACFVNSLVASDPRVPFGGSKSSGFGRELSQEGILEFVNIKTVAVK